MLDGFAAHTHGLRILIEPRLRGLDDVFVFPAFDAALVGRCTLILERACAARLRQVNPHFLAIFIAGEVVRQLVAIERQSGSVSDICLSGEASNAFSIAASRFTSSSSFASFSLSRVLVSSTVSDGSSPAAVWRSAVSS